MNTILEAYDTELFAILKSLQQAKQNIISSIKNIWIFSDNKAAIYRICKNSKNSDQEIIYKIQ